METRKVTPRIHPEARIGHVHLKVADIERGLSFYQDLLGFEVMRRAEGAVFISAGGYHHHIALNTWHSRGAPPAPENAAGLYHIAILYPNRKELARALKRLVDARYPIDGATDHGVSEAIYLRDPDNNGVEIYRDRPEVEWPRPERGEGVDMWREPLDLNGLLAELDEEREG